MYRARRINARIIWTADQIQALIDARRTTNIVNNSLLIF